MTRIQIRRDTSVNWATYNPILADGEFALETDTRKIKIGNGEQPYTELAYQGDSGSENKAIQITSIYQNGQNGYIIYSNKLCHQWGYVTYPGGAYVSFDINLLKPFKNTDYVVNATVLGTSGTGDASAFRILSQSTNKFNVRYTGAGNNSGVVRGGNWQAIGYIA